MSKFGAIITQSTITVCLYGKTYQVPRENKHAPAVLDYVDCLTRVAEQAGEDSQEFQKTAQKLLENLDRSLAIQRSAEGDVTVKDGAVYYQDKQVHGVVVDRILQCIAEDRPFKPLMRFLDRLKKNPSHHSVEHLYSFLEAKGIAITPAGTILVYKSVDKDYKDIRTGTIDNRPGQTPRMPRNEVMDDPDVACGPGFHVGNTNYVQWYNGPGGHTVIAEVDPADVVSVPRCSTDKMRICGYRVICDYQGDLEGAVHSAAQPYSPCEEEVGLPLDYLYCHECGTEFPVWDAKEHDYCEDCLCKFEQSVEELHRLRTQASC